MQVDPDQVRPRQLSKSPVDYDAEATEPTRHLQEVIRAPHEPRQYAIHSYSEKLAEGLTVAERTHHSQSVKDKWPRRLSVQGAVDVPGQYFGFSQCVLGQVW